LVLYEIGSSFASCVGEKLETRSHLKRIVKKAKKIVKQEDGNQLLLLVHDCFRVASIS
jgi:hypothetical protein